jgi:hypothetical protein
MTSWTYWKGSWTLCSLHLVNTRASIPVEKGAESYLYISLLTTPWCLTNRLLVYYWVHVKSIRQSSSKVAIQLLWSKISRLNTKNTKGDCSWKCESSRDKETSKEDNVHGIYVQLSDTEAVTIWAKYFHGITPFLSYIKSVFVYLFIF